MQKNQTQIFDVMTQLALRRTLEERLQSIRQAVVRALDSRSHNPQRINEDIISIYLDSTGAIGLNIDFVRRCIEFGLESHHGERRDSGIPYIAHPLEVGYILCEIGADAITIGAGILHDVEERDSQTSGAYDRYMVNRFVALSPWGDQVYDIVDILTKPEVDKEVAHREQKRAAIRQIREQSGGLKKRTYAVKAADRLDNLLTLGTLKDKPSASAKERARVIIGNSRYILPLAREVDIIYANQGSGLLLYPYMQDLVQQLRSITIS